MSVILQTEEFLLLVKESLFDELADMQFYAELANLAPNAEIRQIIMSIVGDEYGHVRVFASILGLSAPVPNGVQAGVPEFEMFKEGLELAIQGEIHAVARYSLLARLAPDALLRLIAANIAGDEYNHQKIWQTILDLDP